MVGCQVRDHEEARQAYAAAPKKSKSLILDQVVDGRRTTARKYSYDVIKALQQVWATSGGTCRAVPRPGDGRVDRRDGNRGLLGGRAGPLQHLGTC